MTFWIAPESFAILTDFGNDEPHRMTPEALSFLEKTSWMNSKMSLHLDYNQLIDIVEGEEDRFGPQEEQQPQAWMLGPCQFLSPEGL